MKAVDLINRNNILDKLKTIDYEHVDLDNADEHFINGIETAIELIEDAPSEFIWHTVKSQKDLPELCVPVIVEYDRGITVAILDDAWARNQPTWYVNNFPIGLWNAVNRWMSIPV